MGREEWAQQLENLLLNCMLTTGHKQENAIKVRPLKKTPKDNSEKDPPEGQSAGARATCKGSSEKVPGRGWERFRWDIPEIRSPRGLAQPRRGESVTAVVGEKVEVRMQGLPVPSLLQLEDRFSPVSSEAFGSIFIATAVASTPFWLMCS